VTDRHFIDHLADVWAAVGDLGRSFGPDEWLLPTECPGWTVKDHLSHMIGTESMLLGRPNPPVASAADHVRNPIGEFNEAWVAERRPRPGADVLAEFDEVAAARLVALRAMTDEQLDTPGWSPIGEVPYAVFMSIRVMDCWVHEQDMRQATGRPWRLDGPAARAALDRLNASFGYVVGKRVAPPEGTVAALTIDGPLGRTLTLAVAGGRAAPAPDGAAPDVRVVVGSDTYVRLATGRLAPTGAIDSGLVTVEGDRGVGERIVANLAQMP
jgi:uncharacterized protein (TIGR03083 family)